MNQKNQRIKIINDSKEYFNNNIKSNYCFKYILKI